MEPDSPQILYLNTAAGDRIQAMTLAGIRRYAGALGWEVRSVPWQESRPEDIAPLLGAHRPVAGCVVECSDGNSHLPPRLFGRVPVVYLHATPTLYGGRIARVSADNEAVARVAFRELSAGRPAAYAVVGACWDVEWAGKRIDAFDVHWLEFFLNPFVAQIAFGSFHSFEMPVVVAANVVIWRADRFEFGFRVFHAGGGGEANDISR